MLIQLTSVGKKGNCEEMAVQMKYILRSQCTNLFISVYKIHVFMLPNCEGNSDLRKVLGGLLLHIHYLHDGGFSTRGLHTINENIE